MKTTFKASGFRELEKALSGLEKTATRKTVARKAVKAAAEPILDDYQRRTVVASGVLLASETVGTRLNRRQSRMAKKIGKSAVEVHVGTNDPAGVQQEFGNWKQPAEPALGPAWEAEGGQKAVDRMGEVMGPEIERAAGRQARRKARGK